MSVLIERGTATLVGQAFAVVHSVNAAAGHALVQTQSGAWLHMTLNSVAFGIEVLKKFEVPLGAKEAA